MESCVNIGIWLAQYPPVDPLLQGMLYLEDNDANGILDLSEQVEDDEVMKYTLWGMIAEAQGDINNASQYYFHVSNQENPNVVCVQLFGDHVAATIRTLHMHEPIWNLRKAWLPMLLKYG